MLTVTEGPIAYVIKKYEAHLELLGRELTVNKHRLNRLKKVWGDKSTLTPSDVEQFILTLKEGKPASRNRYRAIIRAFLNWAIGMELLDGKFDFTMLRNERVRNDRERRLVEGEEERLLFYMEQDLQDLFYAAIDTGLRKGTLLKLQKKHIKDAALVVPGEITKTGMPQTIPLTNRMRRILSRRANVNHANEKFIFTGKGWREQWDKARNEAGVVGLHWHDLRGEFASRLVEKGVSIAIVSKLLGHTTLEQTGRYIRLDSSNMDDAIRRLDE